MVQRTICRVRLRRPSIAPASADLSVSNPVVPTCAYFEYNAEADVLVLGLNTDADISIATLAESDDVFVILDGDRVIGVMLANAGNHLDAVALSECDGLDILKIPRLTEEN
jgi:uncharacterized protein YuzE